MKKITLLSTLLLNVLIFGQPVLNSSDINPLNLSSNNFSGSSTTLGVGSPGANVTWNFSSLVLMPQGSSSNVSVPTAPYASSFPTANFFVSSISQNNNSYGYYNLTVNKLEAFGASDDNGIIVNFINPQTIFIFPLFYTNSYTDTFQVSSSDPIASSTQTYDAYGTVITPFGTYNNVIRLKQTDSSSFITYNWFKTNPYTGIMSAFINPNNTAISYSFSQPTNLTTNKNQLAEQFSIFPNPTSGNLTIKNATFSEKAIFINVYDVLGNEVIKNYKIDGDIKNIDLSDTSSGLYFVKITDVDNAVLYSDKIIKN